MIRNKQYELPPGWEEAIDENGFVEYHYYSSLDFVYHQNYPTIKKYTLQNPVIGIVWKVLHETEDGKGGGINGRVRGCASDSIGQLGVSISSC